MKPYLVTSDGAERCVRGGNAGRLPIAACTPDKSIDIGIGRKLSYDEARYLASYIAMDAKHKRQMLRFSEVTAVAHPLNSAPKLKLVASKDR